MSAFGLSRELYKSTEQVQTQVRNVFCVGRNYRDHALELGNDVPTTPMIFGKSTHAVTPATGTIELPEGRTTIHHELEIVLWISQSPRPNRPFHEAVGGIALGLDLTDRDAQNRLKAAGHPWEFAKGFKNSAILTDFYVVKDWSALVETPFSLSIHDAIVQQGVASDMIFSFGQLVDHVHLHFGLAEGDILFTGTPAGVGPLKPGDVLSLSFANECWGQCHVESARLHD